MKQEVDLTPPTNSVPVRGYLVDEDDDYCYLQDRGGTWKIPRDAIQTMGDWEGSGDQRFKGRPVVAYVKDGAEILDMRPTVVHAGAQRITYPRGTLVSFTPDPRCPRPPTLGDPENPVLIPGAGHLDDLLTQWVRHLGFGRGQADESCTAAISVCCDPATPEGMVCYRCDSMCD